MRLSALKKENKHQQQELIIAHPKLKLIEAVRTPSKVKNKVLCFLGNYANFATDGVVVRKFVYNFDTKRWIVSDKDLSDDFEEFYAHHFERAEMKENFGKMLMLEGCLLDLD